jgi:hypothetical protein
MEKILYSIEDKVDYYLHKIAMASTFRLDPQELYEVEIMDEETYLLDQVMIEKGLIKVEKASRVITSKGLEISNFGGWAIHQKLLNKETYRPREDSIARKQEEQIVVLKAKLSQLQQEIQLKAKKESDAYQIMKNLTQQAKIDKLFYLIGGIAIGFVLATVLWASFIR